MRSAAFQRIFQSELCWPKWSHNSFYERSLIYDNPLRLDLCQFPHSLSTDLREWHVASAYKVEALLLPRGESYTSSSSSPNIFCCDQDPEYP